jgi:Uncharacterized protein conserved in bacteria
LKDIQIALLLDFYGDLLTEKQREAIELYYNEDLSLAEIAEQTDITRHGIRDRIIKSERILVEMEQKLGLAKRFVDMKIIIESIIVKLENIKVDNEKNTSEIDDIIVSAKTLLD